MFIIIFFYMLLFSVKAFASETEIIRYFQVQERFQYQVELLQHVLNLTTEEYGLASLQANRAADSRADVALMKGKVDVIFLPSNRSLEARFVPIRVALLQGMLGYRLLVATPETDLKLTQVKNIADFNYKLIGGVGIYWPDFRIFNHSNLVTRGVVKYETLYHMLDSSEIDYFTLGANEVFDELKAKSELYPSLRVSTDVAFFYPFPMYYYVHSSKPGLAQRIEVGLKKAEEDGSFRSIFQKHYQDEINQLKRLKLKKVFYLENPLIEGHVAMNYHWWSEQPMPLPE